MLTGRHFIYSHEASQPASLIRNIFTMELHNRFERLTVEDKHHVHEDQDAIYRCTTETATTSTSHSSSLISPTTTHDPLGDTSPSFVCKRSDMHICPAGLDSTTGLNARFYRRVAVENSRRRDSLRVQIFKIVKNRAGMKGTFGNGRSPLSKSVSAEDVSDEGSRKCEKKRESLYQLWKKQEENIKADLRKEK
jgi:hypothetical protein